MRLKILDNYKLELSSPFQLETLRLLELQFLNKEILDLDISISHDLGVRGKYEGILNLMICVKFTFSNNDFEFYIHYDQLEYYILQNKKAIKRYILEDFFDENTMIEKFMLKLKKDIDSLNIQ